MPRPVIERAREVLATLEDARTTGKRRPSRYHSCRLLMTTTEPSEVEAELASMDVDALTPREALQRLYELQAKARGE